MSEKIFLIQTDNLSDRAGNPPFLPWDFSHELVRQIRSDDRVSEDFDYGLHTNLDSIFELADTDEFRGRIKNCIPVGSVEFVHSFVERIHGFIPKPLYIPEELDPFTGRVIHYNTEVNFIDELVRHRPVFVKSATKVKGYTGIISDVRELTEDGVDDDLFHASEIVDILSEWRVFVHRGKILDCRCYSGDPLCYPTRWKVERMVENYKSSPIAYTLDVAVVNSIDTVVIECHNFYSCGLYGFKSPKYPYMLSQAFHELIRNNK